MANAYEDQIADAIATELNNPARGWATLFGTEQTQAAASDNPWYETEEEVESLELLKVDVVTLTIDRKRETRNSRKFDYVVAITMQCKVRLDDTLRIRAIKRAAEQIHDWFDDGHTLTGLTGFICIEANRPDAYILEKLYGGEFQTVIYVGVQVRK